MINVGYKDKIFCGNSVSILKSFYFCICRSKLDYDYDRLYSYNFSIQEARYPRNPTPQYT